MGLPRRTSERFCGRIFAATEMNSDFDKSGMGYVAGALWRGRLAQIHACVPGRKPGAHGTGVCRHLLLSPADHGCSAGRDHGRAGAGSAARQGFVCGHFVVQPGADARSGTDSEERRSSAADSSAVVLDAESLGGEGTPRHAGGTRRRLHCVFSAGPGIIDEQVSERVPENSRARTASRFRRSS
jgi:hypothetical protein